MQSNVDESEAFSKALALYSLDFMLQTHILIDSDFEKQDIPSDFVDHLPKEMIRELAVYGLRRLLTPSENFHSFPGNARNEEALEGNQYINYHIQKKRNPESYSRPLREEFPELFASACQRAVLWSFAKFINRQAQK
tara:strand:- start:2624 stop:3034 length:411 start_codon:yes stop_codon:yes gene_type:complete